jgi:hypothetical protein
MTKLYQIVLSICFLAQLGVYANALDEDSSPKKPYINSIANSAQEKKNIHDPEQQLLKDIGAKLNGPGPFSYFGHVVSTGGDINGDGYSDVLVGAPYHTSLKGAVYIYMGSSTGISTTASLILEGPAEGSQFGTALASAGDVNGDGFSDVIVGTVVSETVGSPSIGSAYVYLGSVDALSAVPDKILLGTTAGFYGTTTLAGIGDVNADGFSDVMVGRSEVTATPQVFVFYGSATGIPQQHAATITLQEDNTALGGAMAGLGDVNGDGYGDVLIASLHNPSGTGSAHLYLGSLTGLLETPTTTLTGNSNNYFGCSVSAAQDINGDGFNDVIIGDYQYESGKGAAFIYLGNSSGISVTPASTLIGFNTYGSFGISVASAGDENADGYADVIIGASGYDFNIGTSNAYLFYGSKVGVITTEYQTLVSPELKSAFGNSVSPAGDVNGDGRSDIIIGAFQSEAESGAAYVYLGNTNPLLETAAKTITAPVEDNIFAITNSGVGDLNGDGFSDVAIGANEYSSNKGIVYIYYGSSNGLPENPSLTIEAPSENSKFGANIAAAGDVNGDGYGDLIVGANGFNNYHGAAYIYLGSATGLMTTPATILTDQPLQTFTYATAVSGAGDINGDGYSDVIVGDQSDNKVFVHMGSSSGVVQAAATILNPGGGNFGWSIANAGDVNADGYNDIVIGDYEYDFNKGLGYVYYGSSKGLSAANVTMLHSPFENGLFGSAVSSAGDINGDGYSDIIIGVPNANTVTVFPGGPEGVAPEKAVHLLGPVNYSSFGYSLASSGDVNGDGYSDIAVGAYQQEGGFTYVFLGGENGLTTEPSVTLNNGDNALLFGISVDGAGDVNGDGYSDILSASYLLASNQLASQLFYGNNEGKHNHVLKLYNIDLSTPISQSNLTNDSFGIGLFVKPFSGSTEARLVWETKANGEPFNSFSPITNYTGYSGNDNDWTAIPTAGTELKTLISKSTGKSTKLRVRVQYRSSALASGQVFSPWIYPQDYSNGVLDQKGNPLPVSLITFTVKAEEGIAKLQWETAWESNSKSFEIEYSINGKHWNTIGSIGAMQNASQVSRYQFDHSTAMSENNFYRLKMVDNDDTFTYSVIRHLLVQGGESAMIYPNPATDLIKIKIPGQSNLGNVKSLKVFNAEGRDVSVAYRMVNDELHISGLPEGVYVFSAVITSGQSFNGKFLVRH